MTLPLVGAIAAGITVAALVLSHTMRGPAPRLALLRHPDADALRDAGWTAGHMRWELARSAVALVTLALVLPMGLLVLVPVVALAPSVWIRLRAEAARERARRAITRVIAGAEAALRSGATLPDALRREAEASADPIARRALLDALRAFDLGESLEAGLRAAGLAARDQRIALALETLALGVGERLPRERLADLLASLADRLTFEERLDDEVRARASGARQQQRLLAALVPAVAVLLILTMPTLAAALGSEMGRFVLVPGAVAFEFAGVVLARRIVREALP